jgi:PAS domain-containing protein
MLLAAILLVITFFILESKKDRKIDLLKQKFVLNYDFEKKEELRNFKTHIDKEVKQSFEEEEIVLKKVTYKTIGYIESNSLNDFDLLKAYLKTIEKENNIELVLFKKDNLNILYGKDSISYIQHLIFNTKREETKDRNLTLQYIYSQGNNNLQFWKDDLNKTVRLSFFDSIKINGLEYYIGSFSTINSIRKITKDLIVSSIKTQDFNIWFYDVISQDTFNFNLNKKIEKSNVLLKSKDKKEAYEILEHYFADTEYNDKFKNYSYFYTKYNFLISVFYDKQTTEYKLKDIIYDIKNDYKNLFFQVFIFILVLSAILVLFTYIFSNFIKTIFNEYNDELKTKTLSLEHWKKRFELAIIASNDGLWDIDFKTNNIYFSNKWLEMFGYAKNEDLPSIKYTTESPLPTGYNACLVVSNSVAFTIYSEFTDEAIKTDYDLKIKLTKTDTRDDGEDLVGITEREYSFSIK